MSPKSLWWPALSGPGIQPVEGGVGREGSFCQPERAGSSCPGPPLSSQRSRAPDTGLQNAVSSCRDSALPGLTLWAGPGEAGVTRAISGTQRTQSGCRRWLPHLGEMKGVEVGESCRSARNRTWASFHQNNWGVGREAKKPGIYLLTTAGPTACG